MIKNYKIISHEQIYIRVKERICPACRVFYKIYRGIIKSGSIKQRGNEKSA